MEKNEEGTFTPEINSNQNSDVHKVFNVFFVSNFWVINWKHFIITLPQPQTLIVSYLTILCRRMALTLVFDVENSSLSTLTILATRDVYIISSSFTDLVRVLSLRNFKDCMSDDIKQHKHISCPFMKCEFSFPQYPEPRCSINQRSHDDFQCQHKSHFPTSYSLLAVFLPLILQRYFSCQVFLTRLCWFIIPFFFL